MTLWFRANSHEIVNFPCFRLGNLFKSELSSKDIDAVKQRLALHPSVYKADQV